MEFGTVLLIIIVCALIWLIYDIMYKRKDDWVDEAKSDLDVFTDWGKDKIVLGEALSKIDVDWAEDFTDYSVEITARKKNGCLEILNMEIFRNEDEPR